jgi:hypothetical protein
MDEMQPVSFAKSLADFACGLHLLSKRPEEGKQKLDSAIDQAAQEIKEGRDAVHCARPR